MDLPAMAADCGYNLIAETLFVKELIQCEQFPDRIVFQMDCGDRRLQREVPLEGMAEPAIRAILLDPFDGQAPHWREQLAKAGFQFAESDGTWQRQADGMTVGVYADGAPGLRIMWSYTDIPYEGRLQTEYSLLPDAIAPLEG